MEKKLILPEHIQKQLADLPESGIGFQIVDLVMEDGSIFKEQRVMNSSHVVLDTADKIDGDHIQHAILSKRSY